MHDGKGIEYNYEEVKCKSDFFQETLAILGFIPNNEKSAWEACNLPPWLGIDLKLSLGALKITKSRNNNILNTVSLILRKIFVSARISVKLAEQLISTICVNGRYCTAQNSISL